MPEEINRVLTDHVSSQLFCPTETAVDNLKKEGITDGVINVGDVMFDTFLFNRKLAEEQSLILSKLRLDSKEYCLVTIHRQENTDSEERLSNIIEALNRLCSPSRPFIVPLHPRTRKIIDQSNGKRPSISPFIQMLEPVSYLDMILLETHSRAVLTDSGGVQKEAFFSQVPCVTLRDETEWVELVENGYNVVVGNDPEDICRGFSMMVEKTIPINSRLYGDGQASERIVVAMEGL
jgi:UDP-GlcNAc3NAcA epimerase